MSRVVYVGATGNDPEDRYTGANPCTQYAAKTQNMQRREDALMEHFYQHPEQTLGGRGLNNARNHDGTYHASAIGEDEGWVYVLVMQTRTDVAKAMAGAVPRRRRRTRMNVGDEDDPELVAAIDEAADCVPGNPHVQDNKRPSQLAGVAAQDFAHTPEQEELFLQIALKKALPLRPGRQHLLAPAAPPPRLPLEQRHRRGLVTLRRAASALLR